MLQVLLPGACSKCTVQLPCLCRKGRLAQHVRAALVGADCALSGL
jgi:hypothetical protein